MRRAVRPSSALHVSASSSHRPPAPPPSVISSQHARRRAPHAVPPWRPNAGPEAAPPSSTPSPHHPPAPAQRARPRLRAPAGGLPRPLPARLRAGPRAARRAGVVRGRGCHHGRRRRSLLQLPHQLRVLRLQRDQLALDLRPLSRALAPARAERLQQARPLRRARRRRRPLPLLQRLLEALHRGRVASVHLARG